MGVVGMDIDVSTFLASLSLLKAVREDECGNALDSNQVVALVGCHFPAQVWDPTAFEMEARFLICFGSMPDVRLFWA